MLIEKQLSVTAYMDSNADLSESLTVRYSFDLFLCGVNCTVCLEIALSDEDVELMLLCSFNDSIACFFEVSQLVSPQICCHCRATAFYKVGKQPYLCM